MRQPAGVKSAPLSTTPLPRVVLVRRQKCPRRREAVAQIRVGAVSAPGSAPLHPRSLVPPPKSRKSVSQRSQNIRDVVNADIFEWARPHVFQNCKLAVDIEVFQKWNSWLSNQLRVRFCRQDLSQVASWRIDSLGRGRSSVCSEDLLVDAAAAACAVTYVTRLSRYHVEGVIRLQVDARLALYFQSNKRGTDMVPVFSKKPYNGWPAQAAVLQRQSGSAEDLVTVGGKKYHVLRCKIITATAHHDALSGGLSVEQVARYYKRSEGFTVQFAGTSITTTIPWPALIDLAEDLMVFGPPLDGSRRYSKCFNQNRSDLGTLRAIFRGLARETIGDVYATSALVMAYAERVNAVLQSSLVAAKRVDPRCSTFPSPNMRANCSACLTACADAS